MTTEAIKESEDQSGNSTLLSGRPYKIDLKEAASNRAFVVGLFENMGESEVYLYIAKLIQIAEHHDRIYEELLSYFVLRIRYEDGEGRAYRSLKYALNAVGLPPVDCRIEST